MCNSWEEKEAHSKCWLMLPHCPSQKLPGQYVQPQRREDPDGFRHNLSK